MERRFPVWVAAAAAFMAAVLLLDRDGLGPQLALGIATAIFVAGFVRAMRLDVRQILWCVAVATTGEVVLSLGWGLYRYGHALIPLYVPPGHGLFFALAMATSRQPWMRDRAAAIIRAVFVAGTVLALWSLAARHDVWGFLWWLGALALVRASRNRLMLAACFVYTIVLEYAGTALGNWTWAADVPFLRLHSASPPAGVGILYILLDLIVMGICALRGDQLQELVRGDGRLDQVALHLVAVVPAQEVGLLAELDPLGDDLQSQRAGHGDDGADDRRGVGVGGDVADERLIDLQCVDGEALQIAQ